MSLVFDNFPLPNRPGDTAANAMVVQKSTNKGATWTDPVVLIRDTNTRLFNDKNAMTADPNNSNFVYAVWDRLNSSLGFAINPEHAIGNGFKGPALFTRTTNGGISWKPPKVIYDPAGNNQTIGNQIVVLPQSKGGTVINFFNEILNSTNRDHNRPFVFNLAFKYSEDRGATWLPRTNRFGRRLSRRWPSSGHSGQSCRTRHHQQRRARRRHPVRCRGQPDEWQPIRHLAGRPLQRPSDRPDRVLAVDRWRLVLVGADQGQSDASNIPILRQQAFTPSVSVENDGTVVISYYDFRNDTAPPVRSWPITGRIVQRHLHRSRELGQRGAPDGRRLVQHPQRAAGRRLLHGRLRGSCRRRRPERGGVLDPAGLAPGNIVFQKF